MEKPKVSLSREMLIVKLLLEEPLKLADDRPAVISIQRDINHALTAALLSDGHDKDDVTGVQKFEEA